MINYSGTTTLTNCTVVGNTAISAPASFNRGFGGGVDTDGLSATATLTNCIVSGNSAFSGGGLENGYSAMTLTNCIVSGNSAHPAAGWTTALAR